MTVTLLELTSFPGSSHSLQGCSEKLPSAVQGMCERTVGHGEQYRDWGEGGQSLPRREGRDADQEVEPGGQRICPGLQC